MSTCYNQRHLYYEEITLVKGVSNYLGKKKREVRPSVSTTNDSAIFFIMNTTKSGGVADYVTIHSLSPEE